MPTMIYHAPFPLNRESKAASGIRPVQMYDAFVALGYEVILVTGRAAQRRQAIQQVRQLLSQGKKIDFLYSESANLPLTLSEPRHFPLHPFLDRSLFKLCREHSVPTSIFYRDIYWNFDMYTKLAGPLLAAVMRALFRYELRWYRKYVSRLYLPSMRMAPYVPIVDQESIADLPPGGRTLDIERTETRYELNLLYVGGLGIHYQLHRLFQAVRALPEVGLTVCVHESQWEAVREEYKDFMGSNISIVHKSGDELNELYAQADVASIIVEPSEYWGFAVPVKLFEYIGQGKPVICVEGIYAADFVRENQCGWVVKNQVDEVTSLLTQLVQDKSSVELMTKQVKEVRARHTWLSRARQVVKDLGSQS